MAQKRCNQCGHELPYAMFHKSKKNADGLMNCCKHCRSKYRREIRRQQAKKKQCQKCGQTLPFGAFAYNSNSEDGRHPWCNNCRKANSAIRVCTSCHQTLPTSQFNKDKNRADGYFPICKKCRNQYRLETKNEIAEYNRQYWEDTQYYEKHKREIISRSKDYYEENREHVKVRVNRYYRQIRHTPKFRLARQIRELRYDERCRRLPNKFSPRDWEHALEYFEYCCAICGRPAGEGVILAADHWIPITYQGNDNPGTVPENILPLCHGVAGCNNSKSRKLPEEWLMNTFGETRTQEILARIQRYFQTVKRT